MNNHIISVLKRLPEYKDGKSSFIDSDDGTKIEIISSNSKLHSIKDAAYREYFPDGKISYEGWFIKGECYRFNGPSFIKYFSDGRKIEVWCKGTILDRVGGPAHIEYYANGLPNVLTWFTNGVRHRAENDNTINKRHTEIKYSTEGKVEYMKWYKAGKIHRNNGPAMIFYDGNVKILEEYWYINDKLNRDDGPAWVKYYENGNVYIEEFYINGIKKRNEGPACIEYHTNKKTKLETWFDNMNVSRENGPANINYYFNGVIKKEEWYINNLLHRENEPAVIKYFPDKTVKYKKWFNNDKLHRDNNEPVIIYYKLDGTEIKIYKEEELKKISNLILEEVNRVKNEY